jgi:hypothetical protein
MLMLVMTEFFHWLSDFLLMLVQMTCFSHNTRMVFWCYEFFTWSCLSWWRIIIAACFSAHLLVLLSEKRILSLEFWSPMLVQVTWLFHNTTIVFWYIFFSLNVTIKMIFSKSMVFSPTPALIFYIYLFLLESIGD